MTASIDARRTDLLRRLVRNLREVRQANVHTDIGKAQALISFVLHSPPLSSEAVDNLNVSNHLRTVLTDIFVLGGRLGSDT